MFPFFIIVHPYPSIPIPPIPNSKVMISSNSVCYFPVTASMWDKFCNSSFQGITTSLNQQKLFGQQRLILPHRGPRLLHPSLLWCFLLELQPCSARKFAKAWICHDLPEVDVTSHAVGPQKRPRKIPGESVGESAIQRLEKLSASDYPSN